MKVGDIGDDEAMRFLIAKGLSQGIGVWIILSII